MTEEILKDWIGNRNKSFVHVKKSGRECWEDSLDGKNLSSAFAARTFDTLEEFLTKTYSVASETIKSMDTGHKVKIYIGGKESCTDFEKVFVATDYIDDEHLSTMDKADIFIGLAVHEASHLLYTDKKVNSSDWFVKSMLNILEDERIERRLGEEKPGVANFIGPVKDYYFGKMFLKNDEGKTSSVTEFVNLLLKIIRYPKDIDKTLVDKYEKYLIECKKVLTPFPSSTQKCLNAAGRIKEIISELFLDEKEKEKEKDHEENSKTKSKGRSWQSKESSNRDNGSGVDEDSKTNGTSRTAEGISSRSDDCGKDRSDSTKDDAEAKYEEFEKVMRELGQEVFNALEKSAIKTENISEKMSDGNVDVEVIEGSVSRGTEKDVFFYQSIKPDKKRYDISNSEIKKYIPAMSRAIRGFSEERSMIFSGLREGRLDTHKLSQAVQGAQTIYKKTFTQNVEKMTVCMLIDESGSMIREGRIKAARNTAVLINEAIGKQKNIELFIYGHSADERSGSSTDIRVYREGSRSNKFNIGALDARDNNRDGTAILEVAKRVRKQTDENVLMLIISDGAPAAQNYFNASAIAHTKTCVEQVEKMGFKVVQICINATYDPALMFRHYIKLEDMSTLARDLGKVITKALTEKKRIRTSTT